MKLLTPAAAPAQTPSPQIETLKRSYLESFAALSNSTGALRDSVQGLLAAGVEPDEMVGWAVEAKYSKSYARSVLSKILRSLGVRRRQPGAGRRKTQEALAFAALAVHQFGARAERTLHAAAHSLRQQRLARKEAAPPPPELLYN